LALKRSLLVEFSLLIDVHENQLDERKDLFERVGEEEVTNEYIEEKKMFVVRCGRFQGLI